MEEVKEEFLYLLYAGSICKCRILEEIFPSFVRHNKRRMWIVSWDGPMFNSVRPYYPFTIKKYKAGTYRVLYEWEQPIFWSFEEVRQAAIKHNQKKLKRLEQKLYWDRMKQDQTIELSEEILLEKKIVKLANKDETT